MNKLKSLIIAVIIPLFISNCGFAASIDSIIQKSDINESSTISVSVKDTKNGKTVYAYNDKKLMNPASVLKIYTMNAALNELGPDYKYKTSAYLDSRNNLYLKLSGDPTLTTESLKQLFQTLKRQNINKINDLIIDASIIDNEEWGIGWMWDDDTNPYLPKYSPFTINENKIDIKIEPSKKHYKPYISTNSPYKMNFINYLNKGSEDKITFERKPWNGGDTTILRGTVKNTINTKVNVSNPQKHFIDNTLKALSNNGISFKGTIKIAPVPSNTKLIAEYSSLPLSEIVATTLKNSNNLYAEMIFRTAGAHYARVQGTTKLAVKMLEQQFTPNNQITIVDGCGISRNNLITTDWATENLNKIAKTQNFETFYTALAKPIEGTLENRLLDISLNLRAKTGTASGISSIAGYITTKNKKKYSFAIIIQNYTKQTQEIKEFEDKLVRAIYEI